MHKTIQEIIGTAQNPRHDSKMAEAVGTIRKLFNLEYQPAFELCKELRKEVGFRGEQPGMKKAS